MQGNERIKELYYYFKHYTGQLMKSLRVSQTVLILWLGLSSLTHAEIYQWQDTKGGKHFSDRFYPDAKVIAIKPGYGFYTVKTVYDGDTVVLEDGRKIRFLGINAPEVQHRNKNADAGGEEAKNWLINKLKNTRVRLVADSEKKDKYGRTLAYLFTEKKDHLNLQLVEAGLAEVSIYPPNLLYVNELVAAEDRAEKAGLGIWRRPEYAVMPVSSLSDAGHPGWTRLTGKVIAIRTTRKSVYLEFSDRFEARIEHKGLPLFPDINDYQGKTVEVRGWLNKNKSRFSMLIRHPSAVKLH
jgi:micrococcal nuclease